MAGRTVICRGGGEGMFARRGCRRASRSGGRVSFPWSKLSRYSMPRSSAGIWTLRRRSREHANASRRHPSTVDHPRPLSSSSPSSSLSLPPKLVHGCRSRVSGVPSSPRSVRKRACPCRTDSAMPSRRALPSFYSPVEEAILMIVVGLGVRWRQRSRLHRLAQVRNRGGTKSGSK